MIYSLVAHQRIVVVDYSSNSGNFNQTALSVLAKIDLSKKYLQYATGYYCFYTFTKERFVFLAVVQSNYQKRIAFNFLKKIQKLFFNQYDPSSRQAATLYSLKEFKPILQEWMNKYKNHNDVDKICQIQKELNIIQEQAHNAMDKALQRNQKMVSITDIANEMNDGAFNLLDNTKKVKNQMWWKHKRLIIAIVSIIIIIIVIIIIVIPN